MGLDGTKSLAVGRVNWGQILEENVEKMLKF